jgi:hypothetical protein
MPKVATALLCDFASVRENLLNVVSGGITRVWRTEFPAPLNLSLALVLEQHEMELDRPHEIDIQIVGEDGQSIAQVKAGFQTAKPPGLEVTETLLVPLALDLRGAGVPSHGAYTLSIAIDGSFATELRFWVRPPPEAPQLPTP